MLKVDGIGRLVLFYVIVGVFFPVRFHGRIVNRFAQQLGYEQVGRFWTLNAL